MLAAGVDDLRATPQAGELLLELGPHVGIWLGQHELGNGLWVELDVDPGPSADLKRPPTRPGKQIATLVAKPSLLTGPDERVVAPGEKRPPEPIGELAGHAEKLQLDSALRFGVFSNVHSPARHPAQRG